MKSNRKLIAVLLVAVAASIMVGGLTASNMGFKLNYGLVAGTDAGSNSGFQSIGLPYNQQVGINVASDLLADVDAALGAAAAQFLQRYDRGSDQNVPYPGGTDYALTPGEGYLLKVGTTGDYIIVGSHDPSLVLTLVTGSDPSSNSGFQRYAHPYHGVSTVASDLIAEIGTPAAQFIQRYDPASDQNVPYPGGTDFALVPGQAYLVKVGGVSNTTFTPAHY